MAKKPSILLSGFLVITLLSGCKEQSAKNHHPLNEVVYKDTCFYLAKAPKLPEKIEFASETAPIEQVQFAERLDKELLVNSFWHNNTILGLKRAQRFFPLIESILLEEEVPDDFKFLALIESNLDLVVSPAGAAGYWQFLESTAKQYNLQVNPEVDERYHIEKSTRAACTYLKDMYSKFRSWTLAAASYNMGSAALEREMERQGVENYYDLHLNNETSRYIFRILALKCIYQNPEDYGIFIQNSLTYNEYITTPLVVDSTISNMYDFAKKQGTTYQLIKLLNPWIRSNKLSIEKNKKYTILIPEEEGNIKPYIPVN
ncbi:MAG: lytic transglycosylase domain-containing protein [Flavobacteriales bacterium]